MKKILKGKVVSLAMQKTAVVEVTLKRPHPLYRKLVTKQKRYKADTKEVAVSVGDTVFIEETRPMAKEKHFRIQRREG